MTTHKFLEYFKNFHQDQRGTVASEYIVLLMLVACTVVAIISIFGRSISERYYWSYQRNERFVVIN